MSDDPQQFPPIFHIDVTANAGASEPEPAGDKDDIMISLLRQLLQGQQQQNQLLGELLQTMQAPQRQRATELGQWREENPHLAKSCKGAADALSRVQNEFLYRITEEIADCEDNLVEGEFMLNEFVDRFGPRLVHINGLLQVLTQLSTTQNAENTTQQ